MRKFLLLGALTFGFVCQSAWAQPQPAQVAQTKSGYDLFLEARALIQDGPNGEPLADVKLAPDENLRLQRLGAARNAGALARLREALKAGIAVSFPENDADFTANFSVSASARELARQLAQESAVRAADGDGVAASQSNLDALQLGAQMSRGPLINGLVGIAISAIGRKHLEKQAPSLDAAQSREVAHQVEEIGAQMQTWTQTLRAEEAYSLKSTRHLFAQMNDPRERALLQTRLDGDEVDEFDKGLDAMLKLPFAQVEAAYQAQFARAVARAGTPYFAEAQATPTDSDIDYVNLNLQIVTSPATRFLLERNTVSNRLLAGSLRLRAIKLESGAYPATFEAGIDPFSPTLAPFVYKRAGDSYVLYSVGPDGVDNKGAEIQTEMTDIETGAKSVSGLLMSDSTGDIMAPIL